MEEELMMKLEFTDYVHQYRIQMDMDLTPLPSELLTVWPLVKNLTSLNLRHHPCKMSPTQSNTSIQNIGWHIVTG